VRGDQSLVIKYT